MTQLLVSALSFVDVRVYLWLVGDMLPHLGDQVGSVDLMS